RFTCAPRRDAFPNCGELLWRMRITSRWSRRWKQAWRASSAKRPRAISNLKSLSRNLAKRPRQLNQQAPRRIWLNRPNSILTARCRRSAKAIGRVTARRLNGRAPCLDRCKNRKGRGARGSGQQSPYISTLPDGAGYAILSQFSVLHLSVGLIFNRNMEDRKIGENFVFGVLTRLKNHPHPVFRSKRDHRPHLDRVARREPHSEALRDRRHDQRAFHPGEALADAQSRAAAERKV